MIQVERWDFARFPGLEWPTCVLSITVWMFGYLLFATS